MAIDLERLSVVLEARLDGFQLSLGNAYGLTDRRARQIEARFSTMSGRLNSIGQGAARGLIAPLAALGGTLGIREVLQYAQAWTDAQNVLRVAGIEQSKVNRTLDDLYEIAQRSSAPLSAVVQLFGRASQAASTLNASQSELMKATDLTGLALKVSGKSAEEAGGALLQLSQLLSGNVVQAQEFNSLIDGLYPLLQAVASGSDRWGGSVAKLSRDVKSGTVTSQEFFRALLAGEGTLRRAAGAAQSTLSGAFTRIQNAMTKYVGETDEGLGATQRLVAGLNALADNFEETADLALRLASVVAGALVGRAIGGLVTTLPIAIISFRLLSVAAVASSQAASFLTARFGAATTAIAGATLASKAFRVAAFGALAGPIGGAIFATVTALVAFADKTSDAQKAAEEHEQALDELEAAFSKVSAGTRGAREELDKLKAKHLEVALAAEASAKRQVQALQTLIDQAPTLYGEEGLAQEALKTDLQQARALAELATKRREAVTAAGSPNFRFGPAGGGGPPDRVDLDKEIAQIQKRMRAIEAETAVVGKSTREIEKAKIAQELLEAATGGTREATAAERAEIEKVAEAMATASVNLDALTARHDRFADNRDSIAELQLETQLLGKSSYEVERATKFLELYTAEKRRLGDVTDGVLKKINEEADAYGRAASASVAARSRFEIGKDADRRLKDLELEASLVGRGALEAETARQKQQLLNEATSGGITIDAAYNAELDRKAAKLAAAKVRVDELTEAQQRFQEAVSAFRDASADALKSFVSDLREGKSATDALNTALGRLADRVLDFALNQAVSSLFSAFFPSTASGFGGLGGGFGAGASAPINAGFQPFGPANSVFAKGGVMTSRGPLKLRRYAGGGIANQPQLAMWGEGSRPEAFVPLPDGRSIPVNIRMPTMPTAQSVGPPTVVVAPQIINNAPGVKVTPRDVDDGRGGRRPQFIIDEIVGEQMSRPGSKSGRALAARGAAAPLIRR